MPETMCAMSHPRFTNARGGKHNGTFPFLHTYQSQDFHKSKHAELIFVACHKGATTTSGHYVSYMKRDGQYWNYLNDSKCYPAEKYVKLNNTIVLLF